MNQWPTLFDTSPLPTEQPVELSRGQKLTARNRALLDQGRHPATRLPLLDPAWEFTCGGCDHHVVIHHHTRTYHKCARHRLGISASEASDIRVSWPACTLYRIGPT
jgi:hypothetical protein